MTPRRRKTDKQPQRETYLQEMCNRLDEELRLVRAENSRLRNELARSESPTRPMRLVA
jgi:hypothetical protein